jgi:flagellar basal body-associated protein FliL
MDEEELKSANNELQLNNNLGPKKSIWLIIGIIVTIVVIFILIIIWFIRNSINDSTYPYIPPPKNTIKSTSIQELLMNILLDVNDVAPLYSVISRENLINWRY